MKISVDNKKALELFDNLKKDLRPEVINKSLDIPLSQDLAALKLQLLSMLNNEQKSKVEVKDQALGETEVKVQKSDEEMIKHLTGVDISRVSKTKDYNSLADGKVAVVSNKTMRATLDKRTGTSLSGGKMPSGVNLRVNMNEIDSYDSQLARAENYFNDSLYVFVDTNGKANYYKNPGIDMRQYVKVVCSRDTGKTAASEKRWNTGTSNRGFADWTVLTEGIERVKRDFINITDVVDKIKSGEYEEAKSVLNKISKGSSVEVSNKIDDLKQSTNLSPSTAAYNNVVKLIKNLRIEKSKNSQGVTYTLVSTFDETIEDYADFQEKIKAESQFWQISNETKWINSVVQAIIGLIKKHTR